ncbi:TlpA family protein disulfide reductase [Candidatus Pacearchaeota archaeon]|nr:MAG: TlpA family protein disulfide reductase [Candidatus Pacearchaeota archaeon]
MFPTAKPQLSLGSRGSVFLRTFLALAALLLILIFGYFLYNVNTNVGVSDEAGGNAGQTQERGGITDFKQGAFETDWARATFHNALTGEEFKIADFKGKTILVESFAVWCPTCKRQQEEIKALHEKLQDQNLVSISLDLDENEDEAKIVSHAQSNGFNWIFARSPNENSRFFIAEFGTDFAAAPFAPVVLVCPDGSYAMLKRGLKLESELEQALNSCPA